MDTLLRRRKLLRQRPLLRRLRRRRGRLARRRWRSTRSDTEEAKAYDFIRQLFGERDIDCQIGDLTDESTMEDAVKLLDAVKQILEDLRSPRRAPHASDEHFTVLAEHVLMHLFVHRIVEQARRPPAPARHARRARPPARPPARQA